MLLRWLQPLATGRQHGALRTQCLHELHLPDVTPQDGELVFIGHLEEGDALLQGNAGHYTQDERAGEPMPRGPSRHAQDEEQGVESGEEVSGKRQQSAVAELRDRLCPVQQILTVGQFAFIDHAGSLELLAEVKQRCQFAHGILTQFDVCLAVERTGEPK